jgi:hypothetical protein
VLCGAVVVALMVIAKRAPSRPSIAKLSSAGRERGPYIGSRVCSECHPGEYAHYVRSGHSRTLHAASQSVVAKRLVGRSVADPENPAVTWKFAERGGRFVIERSEGGQTESFDVDYAFGSDHHATTFVSMIDPAAPTGIEHRITHFSSDDAIALTPGQRADHPSPGTTPRGRELNAASVLACFRCHTTTMLIERDARLDPADMLPNITCERCHGPARAHVEAARAGRGDSTMRFGIDQWTAESQLALCGACHRHPSTFTASPIKKGDPYLARFQPIGLMQSKCYKESGGKMSCVTCHDPHARASSDRASYEPVCLKCHESPSQTRCSVSPARGCIDCHMQKTDSGQRVLFTDHWIRKDALPGKGGWAERGTTQGDAGH